MTPQPPKHWIQTASGRAFDFENITPESVDLVEIAWALSNLCRYNGHTRRFYCPTPDQRILTADLRWIPAGDLREGDDIVGFDEEPWQLGQAGKRKRRFRPGKVITHLPVRRRVVRLVFHDGSTIMSSEEHPWLIAAKVSGNQRWRTTGEIRDDVRAGRPRMMHRFIQPWSGPQSWEDGWLAGVFDGEGSLARRPAGGRSGGMQMNVAQKPGIVLDGIEQGLQRLGFVYGVFVTPQSGVASLQLRGGWKEVMRALGQIRPRRLISQFAERLKLGEFDKQMNASGPPLMVVAAYDEGEQECAGIETSTRTYLCEGLGAHNSVAEHSVLMSRWYNDKLFARAALVHDAREAYVGDMSSPLQRYLWPSGAAPDESALRLQSICDQVDAIVAEKAGITVALLAAVSDGADRRITMNERDALHNAPPFPWGDPEPKPLDYVEIKGWKPKKAFRKFLQRMEQLGIEHAGTAW